MKITVILTIVFCAKVNKIVEMKYFFFFTGVLKLAVLVSILFLVVFLAFELIASNMNFNLGKVLGEFMHACNILCKTQNILNAAHCTRLLLVKKDNTLVWLRNEFVFFSVWHGTLLFANQHMFLYSTIRTCRDCPWVHRFFVLLFFYYIWELRMVNEFLSNP